MKQPILITGLVVLVIGGILLLTRNAIAGGIIGSLGLLMILGSFFVPGAQSLNLAGAQRQMPVTGLDATFSGETSTLNEPMLIEPNAPNVILQPTTPTEAALPAEFSSGPPHPPESY